MRVLFFSLVISVICIGCFGESASTEGLGETQNSSSKEVSSSVGRSSDEVESSSSVSRSSSEDVESSSIESESSENIEISSESSEEQVGGPPEDPDDFAEGWTIVWSDEFNGTKLDESVWSYDEGGHGFGNEEAQYYTRDNISVSDGKLIIEAKAERRENNDYTSGKIVSQNKKSFKYGRIAARIKMPSGDGMWPAFWLLGDSHASVGWPQCGEIDVMEAKGRLPSISSGALHMGERWDLKDTQWDEVDRHLDLDEEFHIYAVEWDKDEIKWFNDDVNFYTSNAGVNCGDPIWCPFGEAQDWDFYLLLNLAVGGHFDNYTMPPHSWTETTMEVDWVRVYE